MSRTPKVLLVGESATGDDRALAPRPWWAQMLRTRAAAILLLDVALIVFFTFASNGLFLNEANIRSLLLIGTEGLLLALGLTMLLGSGIFDLSLGANLVLSSIVGAIAMKTVAGPTGLDGQVANFGAGMVAGLAACLATGLLFGLVNGLLIAILRINALIATLATLGIATGLSFVVSGGSDVSGLPPALQTGFGLATFGAVPLPAMVALVVALVLYLVVRYTRFGMRTLAIGSSRAAAERVGVKVVPHLLLLAVLAGGLAGLAGFIDIARFASSSINGHANDALNAVTAAVIGGTLLEGGKISIPGTVWGAGLAVILQGGLVIIGVSSYFQLMAIGVVLIVAVGLDRFSSIRRGS